MTVALRRFAVAHLVIGALFATGCGGEMGYCDPRWISDYTFIGLFDRMSFVNSLASVVAPRARAGRYRFVSIDAQGVGTLGRTIVLRAPPVGKQRSVRVRDSAGRSRGTLSGSFVPYGDLPGGLLLVPVAGSGG
jgi:hypothetical protein